MARLARVELFAAAEVAVVHVMNRVVRRCFLLGDDAVTGKNYDHRKHWIEDELQKLAGAMGIDLLGFSAATKGSYPSRWRLTWNCWTGRPGKRYLANGARLRRMHRPFWSGCRFRPRFGASW
jgi:hypothetical protein